MPNWTTNFVEISGNKEDISAIKKLVKNGKNPFSLDKIVPMPKVLDNGPCPNFEKAVEYAYNYALKEKLPMSGLMLEAVRKARSKFTGQPDMSLASREDGEKYYACLNETGYPTWYDWRCDFWGTKWDTSDTKLVESNPGTLCYEFYTAWAVPRKALQALSLLFPNVTIVDAAEDEGFYESYTISYKGGEEFLPGDAE